MIKQMIQIVAIFILAFTFSACNANPTPSAQDSKLQSIVKRGELIVGTSGNMSPMTRSINDGKDAIGFDVDLAKSIAKAMGVKLKIKVITFDKLIDALNNDEVDMVISNLTITPKRNLHVAFVGPYITSSKCIVTQIPDLAKANKEELNKASNKLAVTKGSTSEEFAKNFLPDVQRVEALNQDDAVNMVRNHEVAAFLSEYPVCNAIIENNPNDKFVSVFTNLTYDPIGIAIAPQNTHLQNWTQNFLIRADKIGLLKLLATKWF